MSIGNLTRNYFADDGTAEEVLFGRPDRPSIKIIAHVCTIWQTQEYYDRSLRNRSVVPKSSEVTPWLAAREQDSLATK